MTAQRTLRHAIGWLFVLALAPLHADHLVLPGDGSDVVGWEGETLAAEEDTLADIARTFKLGHTEIRLANPEVDFWLPGATKYPQGAEKMLIKAVTGKEVPPGKLPMDVGAVIQNIGTASAIHDAVVKGEVLTTAALTVSGKGIKAPKNLLVPVGTPIQNVIDFCGGVTEDAVKIIVGGPMMGVAQFDLQAPVMKATSGILVLTKNEVAGHPETPCLRCGQCVGACPLNLMPTKLAKYSQLNRFEDAEGADITVCMECGTCAYTCPANIPLVQWIRLGKQKVLEMQRERTAVTK